MWLSYFQSIFLFQANMTIQSFLTIALAASFIMSIIFCYGSGENALDSFANILLVGMILFFFCTSLIISIFTLLNSLILVL